MLGEILPIAYKFLVFFFLEVSRKHLTNASEEEFYDFHVLNGVGYDDNVI